MSMFRKIFSKLQKRLKISRIYVRKLQKTFWARLEPTRVISVRRITRVRGPVGRGPVGLAFSPRSGCLHARLAPLASDRSTRRLRCVYASASNTRQIICAGHTRASVGTTRITGKSA